MSGEHRLHSNVREAPGDRLSVMTRRLQIGEHATPETRDRIETVFVLEAATMLRRRILFSKGGKPKGNRQRLREAPLIDTHRRVRSRPSPGEGCGNVTGADPSQYLAKGIEEEDEVRVDLVRIEGHRSWYLMHGATL